MMTTKEAQEIAKDLRAFRRSVDMFSENKPNLIEKFPNRWVGVLDGKVVGDAPTIGELIATLEGKGRSPRLAMVRFLSPERRKFIL